MCEGITADVTDRSQLHGCQLRTVVECVPAKFLHVGEVDGLEGISREGIVSDGIHVLQVDFLQLGATLGAIVEGILWNLSDGGTQFDAFQVDELLEVRAELGHVARELYLLGEGERIGGLYGAISSEAEFDGGGIYVRSLVGSDEHRAVVVEYPYAVAEVACLRPCAAVVGVWNMELAPVRVCDVFRDVCCGDGQVDGRLSAVVCLTWSTLQVVGAALDAGEGVVRRGGGRAGHVHDFVQAVAVLEDVVAHAGKLHAKLDGFHRRATGKGIAAQSLHVADIDVLQFVQVAESTFSDVL